ncbi:hypothetical protein [Legionella resiliens]|uniref:Uncharacterized protein n=1 Tax=Legionella resiliens TaxID=2905958 RepID=A0ABS8X168_9GAMM|nr:MULTISPECIES: hypothetical protein [unclassified Legionella]MCE0721881.1 hypothetical protein [Legionella sp. 9fVS26]MCE3531035.1 hypothetical protein [Legionella sp. 8cVS16]
MSYKILIAIVLSNLLSVSYAIGNPVVPHSTAVESNESLGSADPYQYCFKNSTWIVPPQTLLAYLYDNANFTPVSDQTVWVISSYNQGYFTGQSYTSINNSILSQRYLIGSVTSEGKVYITFYSGTSSRTDLVNGIGALRVKSSSQCSFIMQMNSGQNGVSGLTHWSYMIPVKPGDVFYNNLPGTNMSVPQFLAQF